MLHPRTSRCGTLVGIGGRSALGVRGLIAAPRSIGCSASSDDDAAPTLNQDWRSFRARMVLQERDVRNQGATKPKAQEHDNLKLLQEQNPALAKEGVWAHALPTPEVGCVLLATQQAPELLGNRWWQLVILLVEHSDRGSVGLLLNRPSVLTLNRKVINTLSSGSGAIPLQQLQTFSDAQLYCGGFSGQQTLHIMHGHADLDGAVEVVPGVYLGGHKAAAEAVLTRGLDPSHFRFFLGTMVWGPGQLHGEIQQGAWACAACARSLVLKQCLELPVPLWKEILKLMGGQYHNDVDGD